MSFRDFYADIPAKRLVIVFAVIIIVLAIFGFFAPRYMMLKQSISSQAPKETSVSAYALNNYHFNFALANQEAKALNFSCDTKKQFIPNLFDTTYGVVCGTPMNASSSLWVSLAWKNSTLNKFAFAQHVTNGILYNVFGPNSGTGTVTCAENKNFKDTSKMGGVLATCKFTTEKIKQTYFFSVYYFYPNRLAYTSNAIVVFNKGAGTAEASEVLIMPLIKKISKENTSASNQVKTSCGIEMCTMVDRAYASGGAAGGDGSASGDGSCSAAASDSSACSTSDSSTDSGAVDAGGPSDLGGSTPPDEDVLCATARASADSVHKSSGDSEESRSASQVIYRHASNEIEVLDYVSSASGCVSATPKTLKLNIN
ncbi:MAG: hypothetical protein WCK60_02055 [Candidatus Nomurabacteria bacterium]